MQYPSTRVLRTILERELSQYFSSRQKITRLLRHPSEYRTSFAIEELVLDLDNGKSLNLIFKDLSWQSLSDEARPVKPEFLHNPLREIEVYHTILSSHQIGAATCYGVHVDESRQSYWIFMEKAPGVELYQVGEFEKWQVVAGWLAEFHDRFAAQVDRLKSATSLLRYDGDFYRRWLQRACTFAQRRNGPQNRDAKAALTELAARYEKVVERLLALPLTFIHGEFYSSNVLIRDESHGMRVCPVDWEMAGWGPGLIDLAALISGKWSEEHKTALAMSYYDVERITNCNEVTLEEFLTALDYCRLHIAVQWLGWAPNWSPPAENAHDWLGEALHLAEELEILL